MTGKVYTRKGRWWISYRDHGKEIRQSVARALRVAPTQVTETNAKRLLKERLAEILRRGGVAPVDRGSGPR
jgi:hypothetical protein